MAAERLACYDAAAKAAAIPAPLPLTKNQEPFSLLAYQLGMTQEEFRKVPYPDRQKYPSGHAICSSDEERKAIKYGSPELSPSGLFGRAGVIFCNYYIFKRDIPMSNDPTMRRFELEQRKRDGSNLTLWNINFMGFGNYDSVFMFTPSTLAKENAQRLYFIRINTRTEHFDEVIAGLAAKFGPPSDRTNSKVKNRLGAEFDNLTVKWSNGVSTILAEKYSGSLEMMSVSFLHDALLLAANNAAEQAGKALGGKL